MDLVDLIISLITRKGLSAKMDIRNFYKAKEVKFKISNVAYYKQRMKLNPEAISFLNNNRIDNYYSTEPNLKKFKEHFITAIDGSKVVLPTTNELLEHYGGQKNKTKTVAMLGFSTVYDVLNNMVFEGIIDRYDYSERALAECHLDALEGFLGDAKRIVLFDRGYLSTKLLLYLLNTNSKFVIRLSTIQFKREQKNMKSNDEWIDINFTNDRINPYRNTPLADIMREIKSLNLRFVKIILDNGTEEYLLTNLNTEIFTYDDINYLYNLRWRIMLISA